jgi:GR25 family glycosyltransferase involved in LPS biosynthesis
LNEGSYRGFVARLSYRAMLGARYLGPSPVCQTIGMRRLGNAIDRIYVINLDRQTERWDQICRELARLIDNSGKPVSDLAVRFPAVDARHHSGTPSLAVLRRSYSLADQLFVEPHPLLDGHVDGRSWRVEMTREEVAVALSHLAVWEMVAAGDCAYALVLEDDVHFRRGFCRLLDKAWSDLLEPYRGRGTFDLLYLSYKEAQTGAWRVPVSDSVFKPLAGLWWLSGYVLSARGAKKLLEALPICGPVDLWLNHQFGSLDVFATRRSIITQRSDCQSANRYSILPVLSQVGVLTRDKPLLARPRSLLAPVVGFGDHGSGLTALAMALSMLGYRCCSDLTELPASEWGNLFGNKRERVFDAYVNIGSLTPAHYIELARRHRNVRFIITQDTQDGCRPVADRREPHGLGSVADELRRISRGVLILPTHHPDKWGELCRFLGREYPRDQYPDCDDLGQRALSVTRRKRVALVASNLKSDVSPWVAASREWHGIGLADTARQSEGARLEHRFPGLDNSLWMLRDDTFPSNLALFTRNNFGMDADQVARLTIRREHTPVREFTSAALCSRRRYLYGRFVAQVRAARVPGLITGMFLHRNSPRQEIDIEFIGNDTRKMLVNVFYNPGGEGARMEYGYRGSPTLIDLGFDASEDFHRYEIDWCATSIRWRVDGHLVYERMNWDPTPIPHLPMQFNFNLWHSRSRELAGKLSLRDLPATAELRALHVYSRHDEQNVVAATGRFPRAADVPITAPRARSQHEANPSARGDTPRDAALWRMR